jgi:PAS domain S-box-containing protein
MADPSRTHSADILRPVFGSSGDDIDLIHSISVELIGERDRAELYGKIVDAAVSIMRSQFGTMQRLCPKGDPSGHGGELELLFSRGLSSEDAKCWRWVRPAAHTSCTAALKSGQRSIIPDFEEWDEIAGTDDLLAFRRAGIRSAQTTPLVSRSGALLGMISTHWSKPHHPSARDLRLLDILARQAADVLERSITEEALREGDKKARLLAAIVEHSTDAMITKDLEGIITSWNAGAERVFGYTAEEIVGKPVTLLIPENRLGEEPAILERIQRGEHIAHFDTVRKRKDGSLIDISLTISPVKDQRGAIMGAAKVARDVTERAQADRLVSTLAGEAEHRTKNVLTTVLATVQLSSAATPEELKQVIGGRIQALADVNALFVESRWAGANVRKIIAQELAPYCEDGGGRASLLGPDVLLGPEAAQALAVTLHELTTNAAKYGALSADRGKLTVEWALTSDGRLRVLWIESDGPPARAPTRRGFGTRVMQAMVAARGGALEFEWKPSGLRCEIIVSV